MTQSFNFGFSNFQRKPAEKRKKDVPAVEEKTITIQHRYGKRNTLRKLTSEAALAAELNWHFKPGDIYHCFSFGDVDALTYVKHVLRQQRILYLALSTWCMAGEDVDDLAIWHSRGMLDRVDFFVGEIFPGSYPEVYSAVCTFARQEGGRVVCFRNHAKVMAIVGEKFDCLIESSANVNTNPRSENTVITVDSSLVREYVNVFNDIRPFNKDYIDQPGYIIPLREGIDT